MFGKKKDTLTDYELISLNVLANYDVQGRINPGDMRYSMAEPDSIAALRKELRKRGILPDQEQAAGG